MRMARSWAALVIVCCAVTGRAEEAPSDASPTQAQRELDAARRLDKAGKYAEAVPYAERALELWEKAREPMPPAVAECLNLLGDLHRKQGNYTEAEPLLQRALQVRETTFGKNHPDIASSLNSLGNLYRDQGLYDRAEAMFQRALRIREVALGKNHPDVAASLNNLGYLYYSQGSYDRVESLFQRALRIREVALGKNHPDVAAALNNLATLYQSQGKLAQAEPLYQRALQTWEAAYGENHPDVAAALNNLATLYRVQGLSDRAEPLYQRALRIREAAFGRNHPEVAALLNNLALLYHSEGEYDRAEPLYQDALQIREAVLGKEHPDVAASLNNLAGLFHEQGWLDRAEPLYQRALQLQETVLGKEHPVLASLLNNLANLYSDQGLYDRAELLYQRALQIREAALGKDHPEVADSINNLAVLYEAQGVYDRAEPLYQRALKSYEAALGKDHPRVASVLINLASLYAGRGLYDRVEPLCLRALQIQEATVGKDHPDSTGALVNLANLYRVQGLYDRAEPLYRRALQIQEASLGENHPSIVESLDSFAQFYLSKNQLASALPLLERSFSISEARLRKEALAFSELRRGRFLSLLRAQDETLYNLLREHASEAAVRRLALVAAFLRKGRSADESANLSRTIFRHLGPADRETFQRLRVLRSRLASLSLEVPDTLSPGDYQARLKELEAQGDALEAQLGQRSSFLRAEEQRPGPGNVIERVVAALPPDSALIEIVAFTARSLVPPPRTPPDEVPSAPAYFALILLPQGDIRVADLGPAQVIDDAVRRLHLALSSHAENYLPAAQELYHLVLQPLVRDLGGRRRLFIAPDGQLNLVPWATLFDGTRFLGDAFDLTYLTSGKDLVRKVEDAPTTRSVVVLADPDFSAPPAPPASNPLERSASLERFFAQQRSSLTKQTWEPLPGTRLEARAIQKLLPQAQLLLGPAATKRALLEVAAPGVLHIATHGFFLGDAAGLPRTRGKQSLGAPGDAAPGRLPSNPLLRAGLVLAGAQATSASGSDAGSRPQHTEDALAMALELAGLNLWGTELVVLSACDTGRGEAKPGQGVYGLRRAFTVAGAETLVTSLWRVDDQTAHKLMRDFYKALKAGRGRAESLREAMRRMRERRAHPYYWAPFILVGDGAPLRSLAPVK